MGSDLSSAHRKTGGLIEEPHVPDHIEILEIDRQDLAPAGGRQAIHPRGYQWGSQARLTVSRPLGEAGTVATQALTMRPLTSISQAPQLPPRQPVGMRNEATRAASSQSWPGMASLVRPSGQAMLMGERGGAMGRARQLAGI